MLLNILALTQDTFLKQLHPLQWYQHSSSIPIDLQDRLLAKIYSLGRSSHFSPILVNTTHINHNVDTQYPSFGSAHIRANNPDLQSLATTYIQSIIDAHPSDSDRRFSCFRNALADRRLSIQLFFNSSTLQHVGLL